MTEPPGVLIEWYAGDREDLRSLFAEAESSRQQLDSYFHDGRVLVARRDGAIVGHLQLVEGEDGTAEIKNMAVIETFRGTGVGRALVEAARAVAVRDGARQLFVATGAADVGNLRFYQRCGFRFSSVERDAFTPQTGYPEPIVIDGIALRDRVWLERSLV